MTKKDYILLANAFQNARPPVTEPEHLYAKYQWEQDVKLIAVALASDNPRFDKERFLTAAGVE